MSIHSGGSDSPRLPPSPTAQHAQTTHREIFPTPLSPRAPGKQTNDQFVVVQPSGKSWTVAHAPPPEVAISLSAPEAPARSAQATPQRWQALRSFWQNRANRIAITTGGVVAAVFVGGSIGAGAYLTSRGPIRDDFCMTGALNCEPSATNLGLIVQIAGSVLGVALGIGCGSIVSNAYGRPRASAAATTQTENELPMHLVELHVPV